MTPVRSTPRWLSRLGSLLLILALLSAFVVPAMAQEGVAPLKPLAGDTSQKSPIGAACILLTDKEKAEYDGLAASKSDGLTDAEYGRFLALGEKAKCAAQPYGLASPEAVSGYTFAQSSGAYTAIAGGSTLGVATNDDTLFPNLDIGFSFTYNDAPYTKVAICSNGYIVMGLTSGSSCGTPYTPISSTTYNNLISALGNDLQGNATTGELRYQTQGSAPNRTFTAQWKSYRKYNVAGDDFNFQITLNETTNVVQIIYGAFTVNATSSTPQVGIKGASNADYSNRTTTTDWSASTAGGTNAATMTLSSAVMPASGQTYTWTPPVVVTPPACATLFSPADLATGVAATANLTWASGGGAPTGYKIFFGTDNPPTNIANGANLGLVTTYDPPGNMAYSTPYYWKIVPYNGNGDATGCSVLSFITEADPTVTTFPYTQNFDGVTAPALPAGWSSTNDNGDAYQWQTNTGAPRSAPNSMYIRYNAAAAMDDWFFSPPLQLTGGSTYNLSFWYRGNSTSSFIEKMEVKWGTAPNAAGMTGGQIFNNSNINFTTYTEGSAGITPGATGIYYIGWHGYSIADQFNLYVDDVSISLGTTPPACATSFSPADLATNVQATANLTWASGGGGPTGYKIFFGTDNPPTNIANGADLGLVTTYDPPGNMVYVTPYYWKIVPYNANGDATGCSVLSFTTQANPNYGSSGGYNFANSTPGAAGSPPGQPTYNWITEQTNDVTTWTNGDADDGYVTVDLTPYLGGAGFPFFGANQAQLYISSNGFVAFGTAPSITTYGQNPFPNVLTPNNLIAGAWMDLDLLTTSNPDVHLYYGGDASKFVITYWHARRWTASPPNPNYVTFQIILYPNGKIVTQYNEAESFGTTVGSPSIQSDAVIGIEDSAGALGIGYRVDGVGGPMFGSPLALAMAPNGVPLAITLASFGAQGQSDRIVISWETLSEIDNAGFNLYRADDAAGPPTLLAYVPSQAPGSPQGFAYSYDDLAVQPGQTYWYWLEDVSLGGATTLHGPVSATVSTPTAVTLASLHATPLAPAIPAAAVALAGLAGLMAAAGVAVRQRRAR